MGICGQIGKGWQPQAQLGDGLFPTIPKACGFEAATQAGMNNLRIPV